MSDNFNWREILEGGEQSTNEYLSKDDHEHVLEDALSNEFVDTFKTKCIAELCRRAVEEYKNETDPDNIHIDIKPKVVVSMPVASPANNTNTLKPGMSDAQAQLSLVTSQRDALVEAAEKAVSIIEELVGTRVIYHDEIEQIKQAIEKARQSK